MWHLWPFDLEKCQNSQIWTHIFILLGNTDILSYGSTKSDDIDLWLIFFRFLRGVKLKVNMKVVRFSRSMCQNVRIAKENENMQSHFQFFFQGQILDQKVQNRVICWPLTLDLTLKKSKLSPKNVWVDLSWQNLQFEILGDKIGWLSCWPSILHPLKIEKGPPCWKKWVKGQCRPI